MAWLGGQRQPKPATPGLVEPEEVARPSAVSLYDEAPKGEVTIEEFELCALDRLQVLKGLEDAKARGKKSDDLQALAKDLCRSHLGAGSKEAARRKDLVSHWILRLAYCRTEDLRRWFLQQECDLFRLRFREELPSQQVAFIRTHRLGFETLEAAEFAELQPLLAKVEIACGNRDFGLALQQGFVPGAFFKVDFERVPDLVAQRRVLLRKGTAYVSRHETASLVVTHFRSSLSKALAGLARKYATDIAEQEADRLTPILTSLSGRYLGTSYGAEGALAGRDAVSAAQLPQLAAQSFPLCMQHMYGSVRSAHHLHHQGRLQLGLFLKGIGLTLEEALKFWRMEFAPKCPGEQFEKKYAYNVRYNYGREGRKSDYTPYSCLKIISALPGQDQVHGCPYRVFSAPQLTAALSRMGLSGSAAQVVTTKARDGHYQLACASAFEGSHRCACDTGINHPNQYFDESRKVYQGRAEAEEAKGTPGAHAGASQGQPAAAATPQPPGSATAGAATPGQPPRQ